uniref:Hexosyltransferase n=1 Tax=Acrobeloides nanus TaxID=290746 RepID=A0A914CPT8_9BILA
MVAIMSDAQEFAIRDIIRQTWLKLYNKGPKKKKHFFIIGIKNTPADTLSKLKEEQMLYNDLAFLEDHVESYNNLARKTADTMRFMSKHYLFDYLLKVDTDSFVRIKPLIDYLIVLNHPRLYLGYMDGKSPTGGGYVLGRELVEFIANNFHLLKFFQNEDVSVATWIAGIDVKYIHDVRFDTEWDSRGWSKKIPILVYPSPYALAARSVPALP